MYLCFKCPEHFRDVDLLIHHLKCDHFISGKFLKLICIQTKCNQTFSNYTSFRKHLKTQHSKDSNVELKDMSNATSEKPNEISVSSLSPVLTHTNRVSQVLPLENTTSINPIPNIMKNLKTKLLKTLLSLHANNSMSRKQVIEIQNMMSSLISDISVSILSVLDVYEVCNVKGDLEILLSLCKEPFSEFKSEYKLLKYLNVMNLYERPLAVVIEKTITEKTVADNHTLDSKSADIYIVPLKFQFKKIFEIPGLLDITLENTQKSFESSVLSSFASGDIFKMKKKLFDSDLVIPYTLFFDDFQINNGLGSHTYSICGC